MLPWQYETEVQPSPIQTPAKPREGFWKCAHRSWGVTQPPLMKSSLFFSDFLRNSSWGVSTRWGSSKQEDNRRLFAFSDLWSLPLSNRISLGCKSSACEDVQSPPCQVPRRGDKESEGTGNSKSISLVSSEEGKKSCLHSP